jgi:hypothetical protein
MSYIYHFLARSHRSILVLGTILVSVSASLAAADGDEPKYWLLLLGGGVLLFVADSLSEFERTSRDLATSTGRDIKEIRADVMNSSSGRRTSLWFSAGLLVIVVALAWSHVTCAWSGVLRFVGQRTSSSGVSAP